MMADGEHGPAVESAMKILVALGGIFEAEKLVDVTSVHMPGSSVVVSGDAGLQFVEDTWQADATFKVPTTLNTGAIDFELWRTLGISESIADKQHRLTRAYEGMGAISLHSCCPYLSGNIPRASEQVAWGESSAVAYANSVLSARTNREGGPAALASAITGKAPLYGYRLDENRGSTLVVRVDTELAGITDYGALGYHVGRIAGDGVPFFAGISSPTTDELKMLGAALASSGAVALFHIEHVTPESEWASVFVESNKPEEIDVGQGELRDAYSLLCKAKETSVDLVCIGCPHCSIQEVAEVAGLLKGKRVRQNTAFWVCTSAPVKTLADRLGLTKTINDAGALIVRDTCPVLAPMKDIASKMNYRTVATNSAKLANYAPGQCNLMPHYGDLKQCVNSAIEGKWAP